MRESGMSARAAQVCAAALGLSALLALAIPPATAQTPVIENFGVGADVYVRSLAVDRAARALWVGTSAGVHEIDLASMDVQRTLTRKDGLANEYIFAIGLDPRGGVWFGTNAGGASYLSDGALKTYFPMHGLADYWVYAFDFTDEGAWIGTWDGASYYDNATGNFTNYRDELINIWVYGIDIDPRGRVWFGTEGGVSMYDGEAWRAWTHDDGLGAANVKGLPASDNTGLGTKSRHDLNILAGSQETYNPNYVFSTRVDNQGRGVWFGTWGGGLSLFDGEDGWTTWTVDDGLAGNVVYSLAQASDGTLWAGTNHGVSRYDGKTWTSYSHGLAGQDVYAIALEDDRTIWLGTKGAATRLTLSD